MHTTSKLEPLDALRINGMDLNRLPPNVLIRLPHDAEFSAHSIDDLLKNTKGLNHADLMLFVPWGALESMTAKLQELRAYSAEADMALLVEAKSFDLGIDGQLVKGMWTQAFLGSMNPVQAIESATPLILRGVLAGKLPDELQAAEEADLSHREMQIVVRERLQRIALSQQSIELEQRFIERTSHLEEAVAANAKLAARNEQIALEMSHRIMNSLQLLQSILALEVRAIEDPSARAALEQGLVRLRAVAVVHRQLLAASRQDVGSVELGSFVQALCNEFSSGILVGSPHRLVAQLAPGPQVPAARAVSVGMIATELVLNALKHGFSSREGGMVRVQLDYLDTNCRLTVADNGGGKPAASREGVGSKLVAALLKDLGGTMLERSSSSGTEVTIEFHST